MKTDNFVRLATVRVHYQDYNEIIPFWYHKCNLNKKKILDIRIYSPSIETVHKKHNTYSTVIKIWSTNYKEKIPLKIFHDKLYLRARIKFQYKKNKWYRGVTFASNADVYTDNISSKLDK